jgi:hypothetical protein
MLNDQALADVSVERLPSLTTHTRPQAVRYRVEPPVTVVRELGYSPGLTKVLAENAGLICLQAWITPPDDPRGVIVVPPLRGYIVEDRQPESTALVENQLTSLTPADAADSTIVCCENLRALAEDCGFAQVREDGFADRVFFFRDCVAFAYENAREALQSDPARPADGVVFPHLIQTRARTCALAVLSSAGSATDRSSGLHRALRCLSAILTREQDDLSIELAPA